MRLIIEWIDKHGMAIFRRDCSDYTYGLTRFNINMDPVIPRIECRDMSKEALYQINEYFENNGIIHIFDRVLGVETHKSKVEKFKILMIEHGVTDENAIFVTDTLGDIFEAKKVGIRTIAVDFGFHERERLEKGKPLKIISDFRHLLPELEQLM